MSTAPLATRERPAETVAGFLAALAIFGGLIAIAQRPVTIGLTSLLIALVAAAMAAGRNRNLAAAAVAIAGVSWLVGMIVCVFTDRPLW
ncbi:MAG TPA: hypothetical protein VFT18_06615 [Gaiellaceae bacterium]|nr:hypothetical protein [Gaiellaceae bacterium]